MLILKKQCQQSQLNHGIDMSRTIEPNVENELTLSFMPNVCGNYTLGIICHAVDIPIHKSHLDPNDEDLFTFPYEMSEEQADDASKKLNEAIQEKTKLYIAYNKIIENGYSVDTFTEFLEYCKFFSTFLKESKGYTCI